MYLFILVQNVFNVNLGGIRFAMINTKHVILLIQH